MTVRARHLLFLLAGAHFCCATPGPSPIVPDSLVVEAYRLYGRGDCAALRNTVERTDLSAATPEQQAALDLLVAFCAEREGEILSAKDRYAAVIAGSPRSFQAFEAALRLRELARLEKQGMTREELNRRADQARESPLYQHDAKPLARGSPSFPPGPSAAEIDGWVLVDFEISRNGGVNDVVVLASEPPFLFDGAALSAVRNWLYQASDQSEPRRVTTRLAFAMAPPKIPTLVATRVDRSELDPLERRGREIFESIVVSGRAYHALGRAGQLSSLWNFIVVPDEDRSLVRFIDDQEKVFADVLVDVFSSELEEVTLHEDPIPLPADQYEMWRARVDALALAKARRLTGCTESYSTAVLPSLEPGRSWDVYMLSLSRDGRSVPLGGHYRISIFRDPGVTPEWHAFADSCPEPTSSPDSERLTITENASSTPTEVHVFLSLRYDRSLAVAVRESGLWFVERGRMRRAAGDPPGSASR